MGARANRKVADNTPSKICNWKSHFVFVEDLNSFALDRSWRELARAGDRSPSLSKKDEGLAKLLMEFPKKQDTYRNLMSRVSLI